MRVKTASGVLLFALIAAVFVHGQSQEIRMSGVYSAVAGDSAETASKIAALDARRKVIQQTATQLGALPAVKGMNLSEETLGALAFGLVDIEVQPPTSTPPAYRAQAAARLDSLEALARLRALRRDVEVTNELRRLSRDQNGDWEKLAGLSAADRARAARRLEARQSVARSAVLSVADRGFMAPTQEIREARVRARKLAEEARALDPESPAARYRLGDLLMLENELEAAEREFRAAIAADANFAQAYNKLGNALVELDRNNEALAAFREALRLDPKYVTAHVDLGNALGSQGKTAEALAEFREAIRIDATFVDGHNNLGIALAIEEKFVEAAAAFREVIRLDPESALGHYNLALALAAAEKDAEAIVELREAVRLNPGHYNAQYQLGDRLRLQGELEGSVKAFKEFLRVAPDTPDMGQKRERAKTFIEAFEEP